MKNITISLDDKIIAKSRIIAARRGTSLNGLVRAFLERVCGESGPSEEATWLDEIFDLTDREVKPVKPTWTRDDLHRF